MTDYSTGLFLQITEVGYSLNITPSSTLLLFARRTTGGKLILPQNGYPLPSPFIPTTIPIFPNGKACGDFFSKLGLRYALGFSFNISVPSPSAVSSPLSDGSVVLTWSSIPQDFIALQNQALTGTVTQGNTTGTVKTNSQISIVSNGLSQVATLSVVPTSGSFNTSGRIVISGVDTSITRPDPTRTDEAVMGAFAFFNQTATQPPSSSPPSILLSILNDDCTTVNPKETTYSIAVPTQVIPNDDGTVDLIFPIDADNLGYIPTKTFGNSIVAQPLATVPASGVLDSLNIYSPTEVVIRVKKDYTGTFDSIATHGVEVTLDSSYSAFDIIGSRELNYSAIPFEIKTLSDLTDIQSTFYQQVLLFNQANGVNNNKFNFTGYYANIQPKTTILNLPTPNSDYFAPVYYPIEKIQTEYAELPITVACAKAFADLNVDVYTRALSNVALNLAVSSDPTSYLNIEDCNIVVGNGWTPIQVVNNGQPTIFRNVTSLITDANGIKDIEFRYISLQQKKRWFMQQMKNAWQQVSNTNLVNGGMQLNSQDVRNQFKKSIQSILLLGASLNYFVNVNSYISAFTVDIDPQNPTGCIINNLPLEITPELSRATVNAQIYSVLIGNTFTIAA